ncbi:AMP-binding protein [Actinokineospora soli]|uniref:AMP-binding protein n=1 Tax=Actinokineospora soli TaxID=1048753 RepID=A0ABW2TNL3_9PSEU
MGRPAFTRFLVPRAGSEDAGVTWGGESASWEALLRTGRERAESIRPRRAYLVDPTAGIEALVSMLAVATVPDTVLLWVDPASFPLPKRSIAPALHQVDNPMRERVGRPMWAIATSGSSGSPKLALGYADAWEMVALHYERAMFGGALPSTIATCLPMQFSAAFFMTVLPSLLLRRDLVVFSPHDWKPVQELARDRDVFVLGVPALAAAACLGTPSPVDMSRVSLFLGGGHVSAERVALIRERFAGVSITNLYGTAETGAIAIDRDPGHNQHVGPPLPGKAVWLEDQDDRGVGAVAVAGPDCCRYLWRPGSEPVPNAGYVASTDYGRFDAAGNLCLEGRVDGGEKLMGVLVYPRSVERHLLALPGVVDARVLVERTPSGLEHLAARVVGTVNADQVREHCSVLADAEQPTRIECIAEDAALAAYSANGKL